MTASDEAKKALEGVSPGPWECNGEPWNLIVWNGSWNRVCFMAHSNGLDDDRDVANARFVAWAREGVPALLAEIASKDAEITRLTAQPSPDVAALVEALREANGILEDALQEVGDDYPGSNCQAWCQQQVKEARAALARVKGGAA